VERDPEALSVSLPDPGTPVSPVPDLRWALHPTAPAVIQGVLSDPATLSRRSRSCQLRALTASLSSRSSWRKRRTPSGSFPSRARGRCCRRAPLVLGEPGVRPDGDEAERDDAGVELRPGDEPGEAEEDRRRDPRREHGGLVRRTSDARSVPGSSRKFSRIGSVGLDRWWKEWSTQVAARSPARTRERSQERSSGCSRIQAPVSATATGTGFW